MTCDVIVVSEIANIGLTLLGIAVTWIAILWLDRNVFNRGRYKND